MSKKLNADSAQLFFIVCTKQYMNGVISLQTYKTRLDALLKMTKRQSSLYSIVSALLDCDYSCFPDCITQTIEKEDWDSELISLFHNNNDCLNYLGTMMVNDLDPCPSIPHLHVEDKRTHKQKKINIFTGESSLGDPYSLNELVVLWNDPTFTNKIKKNLGIICSKHENLKEHN